MKKTMIFGIMLLLLVAMVSAGGSTDHMASQKTELKVNGLENAMLHVQDNGNENSLQMLEQNWNRFQERNQNRFQNCNDECEFNLSIDGANQTQVRVQEKVQLKLLGISGTVDDSIVFDANGDVVVEKNNIWSKMKRWGFTK